MTHDHSALISQLDALKEADPAAVFSELIRTGLQALIDAEATEVLGAGRYERTSERTNYLGRHPPEDCVDDQRRCGGADPEAPHRVVLPQSARASPTDRSGPVCGDHVRRTWTGCRPATSPATGAATAYATTSPVRLGVESGVSTSTVSRICQGLDVEIARFRESTLTHTTFPYVFLDAT